MLIVLWLLPPRARIGIEGNARICRDQNVAPARAYWDQMLIQDLWQPPVALARAYRVRKSFNSPLGAVFESRFQFAHVLLEIPSVK